VAFFSKHLPTGEYYRIALSYPEETIFLDIETTGLSLYYDQITLVGWSMGQEYGVYIAGKDEAHLRDMLEKAKVIVTFNGSMFDLKFLRKTFEGMLIPPVHIDLRFFSRRVGLSGGQKNIEREVGFKRAKRLVELRGDIAPILWHKYRRGDNKALRRLIEYNHADVEGMKYILDVVIGKYYTKNRIPYKVRGKSQFSKNKSKVIWKKNGLAGGVAIEKYKGSIRPMITYGDLNNIYPLEAVCVIGIDLVSSEERETGYCILEGGVAEVCRVKTDQEMIDLAIDSNVNLVSIDSPLSIPKGRISYFDDDPFREKYGITRLCERILKRRGINSYPCLIPSMQKLTQRGMELAKKFRSLGIPVIESYPGAAQDIMSIPRKQAGLKYLKEGISEFGIEGMFVHEDVSHDELDAITSAIVGQFFWTGMYEALGDEDEDYLIIPDLNTNTKKLRLQKVIGVSGHAGSGKTIISSYIKEKGYVCAGYDELLESSLVEEGNDRIEISLRGNSKQKGKSQRCFSRKVVELLDENNMVVIDGILFLDDVSLMREGLGPAYVHLHVKSVKELQLMSMADEVNEDIMLNELSESVTDHEISQLEGVANVVIENNCSIAELYEKIDKLLEDI
jgi:predicted nuclease with RNAse H fold/dephospho-CoA kinase